MTRSGWWLLSALSVALALIGGFWWHRIQENMRVDLNRYDLGTVVSLYRQGNTYSETLMTLAIVAAVLCFGAGLMKGKPRI